jgi:hypothetical protein
MIATEGSINDKNTGLFMVAICRVTLMPYPVASPASCASISLRKKIHISVEGLQMKPFLDSHPIYRNAHSAAVLR